MAINVLISCARKSREKEIVKNYLRNNPNIGHIYDCNDTPTDYNREESKQSDIDRHISQLTDWFIFLCPFDFVGKYTFHELEVAVASGSTKSRLPMISIFFSKNPQKELDACNAELSNTEKIVAHEGDVSREDINRFINPDPEHHPFYVPEPYETGKICEAVETELRRFLSHQLRLYRYETFCREVNASDIFFDHNRVKEENGFNDAIYLERAHDRMMLENANNHLLICGAPASGKSRAVLEYIRKFSEGDHRFITVRGAQNLLGSGVGHRCINLSHLTNDIIEYDKYLDTEDIVIESGPQHRRFIVIDQIDSMLGDDVSALEKLFYHATSKRRPNFQIILTTTLSGYESLRDLFEKMQQYTNTISDQMQSTMRLQKIDIAEITSTQAEWVWRKMEQQAVPMPSGKVVGDYIPKLVSYNDRLVHEAYQFNSLSKFSSMSTRLFGDKASRISNSVGAFVRSVQLVRKMRRAGQTPLCLVLMVLKEEIWEGIKDKGIYVSKETPDYQRDFALEVQTLLSQFFVYNNILQFSKVHQEQKTVSADGDNILPDFLSSIIDDSESLLDDKVTITAADIDFKKSYIYEGDGMNALIDPIVKMTIINDQAWDMIEERSKYDYSIYRVTETRVMASSHSREEAIQAMTIWYRAFYEFIPVQTLIHILLRSPLNALDRLQGLRYQKNDINNYAFVWRLFHEMIEKLRHDYNSGDAEKKAHVTKIFNSDNFLFLNTLLITNMSNVEEIRKKITKADGGFKDEFLCIDFVSELYGQAYSRTKALGYLKPLDDDPFCTLAREMYNLIPQEKKQNTNRQDLLHYHLRQLQILPNYNEADKYLAENNLMPLLRQSIEEVSQSDSEEDKRILAECVKIMDCMASHVLGDKNFIDWIAKMDSYGLDISFKNINAIIRGSTRGKLNCKKQHRLFRELLTQVDQSLRNLSTNTSLGRLYAHHGATLVSETLRMLPSWDSAQEVLVKPKAWLKENLIEHTPNTIEIWEAISLTVSQPFEYNRILKHVTDESGDIKDFWAENTILRDKLLNCAPFFSDSIELFHKLFCDSEKAQKRLLTTYTLSNICKLVGGNYRILSTNSVNRSYENFIVMISEPRLREIWDETLVTGDLMNHRFILNLYDMIVTRRQEEHFISLLGENNWNVLCTKEELATLRIRKDRIYAPHQVLDIVKGAVQRQLSKGGVIDDSLFNNAVSRMFYDEKSGVEDQSLVELREYLRALVDGDTEYFRQLSKSDNYFRSILTLGIKGQRVQFHSHDKELMPVRDGYWLDEEYHYRADINDLLYEITKQTNMDEHLCEKYLDPLLDLLEDLVNHPRVTPDIGQVNNLLKNRLDRKYENKHNRHYRNITPSELILITKYLYCYRGIPITTSIINNILEGIANYFEEMKETQEINKSNTWSRFCDFRREFAAHTKFDGLTYYHILRTWPEKIDDFDKGIEKSYYNCERLLSRLVELERKGFRIRPEWKRRQMDMLKIIGQL